MNRINKVKTFNKRWNIIEDTTSKKQFSDFKTRIISIFQYIDQHVSHDDIEDYCNVFSIPLVVNPKQT